MSHPIVHAENSAKKFGGKMEDYIEIHSWFDESKALIADWRHRSLRHHSQGIFDAEKLFGYYIINSEGKKIPVRYIGEQHVIEDLGFIPTFQDYIESMSLEQWMGKGEQHKRIVKQKELKKQTFTHNQTNQEVDINQLVKDILKIE